MYELIQLGPSDWAWSTAGDVSEDGEVVGLWSPRILADQPAEYRVFHWAGDRVIDLTDLGVKGTLGFDKDDTLVVITDDGTTAAYRNETVTLEPYEWRVPVIEVPAGFAIAKVNIVNRRGEAVGTLYPKSENRVNGARGFVASDGAITVLAPSPGGDTSVAWWISDAGQVIGGPAREETEDEVIIRDGRAFLYDLRSRKTTDLGTLPGFVGSMAWGVNDKGEVVGESWKWDAGDQFVGRAFLYDPITNMMFDLNDLIPSATGWLLTAAYDINIAGQIVGEGMLDGTLAAILLQPQARRQVSDSRTVLRLARI